MSTMRLSKGYMKIGSIYIWNGFLSYKKTLDRIDRIFWIFIFSWFPEETKKTQCAKGAKILHQLVV